MLDPEYLNDNLTPIYQVESLVTHVLFADYRLIMSKATIDSAITINRVMQNMKENAGLVMNENKSNIFFRKRGLQLADH